jgi:hypothetical protein
MQSVSVDAQQPIGDSPGHRYATRAVPVCLTFCIYAASCRCTSVAISSKLSANVAMRTGART